MTPALSTDRHLVCPETKLGLRRCKLAEAEQLIGAQPLTRRVRHKTGLGDLPARVMLREDHRCAYPVIDGIPVLFVPEQLVAERDVRTLGVVDISNERYAESADEMSHYNAVAQRRARLIEASPAAAALATVLDLPPEQRRSFPEPRRAWLDATYEPVAQWEAFRHLAPMTGKTVLQVGGKGSHAVRFLLAGAAEAWLISPMLQELEHGRALARHVGVEDAYHCVAGIAEEMPFAGETFDAIYSESCVHHMVTELASAECRRILRRGGRLAAVEPWRAPFYQLGISIFGKREKGVHCRPMTMDRAEPFCKDFDDSSVLHHGALTRYPLLALAQLGYEMRPANVFRITRVDDALCSLVRPLRTIGSSTAILGTRGR